MFPGDRLQARRRSSCSVACGKRARGGSRCSAAQPLSPTPTPTLNPHPNPEPPPQPQPSPLPLPLPLALALALALPLPLALALTPTPNQELLRVIGCRSAYGMPFTSRGLFRVQIHRRLGDFVRYTRTVAANASMRERLKSAQQERYLVTTPYCLLWRSG
jgi:hypothetical protein